MFGSARALCILEDGEEPQRPSRHPCQECGVYQNLQAFRRIKGCRIDVCRRCELVQCIACTDKLPQTCEATLHVQGLPGDSHHKFTVFLFDALYCGSSACWSITELLASLGIERVQSYISRRYEAWNRAGLRYELQVGCTEMVILLLARWSFCPTQGGGFKNKKDRSACESVLRTLCKALHEHQTIKMPFCLRPVLHRHECVAIVGKDLVFISVQQDGIVDLSELRARAQSSHVARMWLKHIDKKFGCEGFDLVDLLRWSQTLAFSRNRPRTFHMQVVWNIGRALEKFILGNLSAQGGGEVSGLRLECEVSPSARHRCFLPLPGCQRTSAVAASSSAPWSPQVLLKTAQQDPFMEQNGKTQQTMTDTALRTAAFLKQTTQCQTTRQVPLLMQQERGDNAIKRPAKRSRQASPPPKQNSENHATERPTKSQACKDNGDGQGPGCLQEEHLMSG